MVNELAYPLTRIKNISILEYRTPSTLDSWIPNTFTDITKYFEEKCERLQSFKSQKDRWYFQEDLLKSFHSNFQSYKKGIKYVEKFKTVQFYDFCGIKKMRNAIWSRMVVVVRPHLSYGTFW